MSSMSLMKSTHGLCVLNFATDGSVWLYAHFSHPKTEKLDERSEKRSSKKTQKEGGKANGKSITRHQRKRGSNELSSTDK